MKIRDNLLIAASVVGLLWAVFLVDWLLPWDLRAYGIRPRSLAGLIGIPLSPFLHAGLGHIMANSGALFVLLTLALSYNRTLAVEALVIIVIGGGGLVWLFGAPHSVHIGASGVIFGLIGFLLFLGIFRRELTGLLVAVLVFFVYGGVMIYGFIPMPGVSWSGHVFGFLAGVGAAWLSGQAKKAGSAPNGNPH